MSHDVNLRRNIDRHSLVFAAWHHTAAGGLSSLIFVEDSVELVQKAPSPASDNLVHQLVQIV